MQKNFWASLLILIFIIAFMTAGLDSVWAIDSIEQLNNEFNQEPAILDRGNLVFNMVKLLFILAFIIALAWLVIKVFAGQVKSRKQGNWLQVVDEIILGQNKGILLCKINHQLYALGVTEQQINFLFSINDPQFLEEIEQYNYQDSTTSQAASQRPLGGQLKSHSRFTARKNSNSYKDFHNLMQEQLEKIQKMAAKNEAARFSNRRSDNNEKK